jgi:hypothetical protein
MNDELKLTLDDRIQVEAFKSFFRHAEGTPEERFATAICKSSDDEFAHARKTNPGLYAEFCLRFGRKYHQESRVAV